MTARAEKWSGGVDNRFKKPIGNQFPSNNRVPGRVGELNRGGCFGALVGRRLVLTAAREGWVPTSLVQRPLRGLM
jgi:hypothetical protein